jgi:hypothetical protein
MNIDHILRNHSSASHSLVVVTEVTRMKSGYCCVAGLDLASKRMVRPLQSNGTNWPMEAHRSLFKVGNVLDCEPTGRKGTVAPHSNEDTSLRELPAVVVELTEADTYELALGAASGTIADGIGQELIDNKYVEVNAQCRSLAGVRVTRAELRFYVNGFNKLRLELGDASGVIYDLPVTGDELLRYFGPPSRNAPARFSTDEANLKSRGDPGDDVAVVRVGFARPWEGPNGQYQPPRCYLQANGIIFSQDPYGAFI